MIKIKNISKNFAKTFVVDDISLEIARETITVLVGTSGAGKSTLLRMINRLVEPSSGFIFINNRNIMDIEPHILRRGIGYVIQSNGLFPHMNVADNIATVPRLLGWDEKRISYRIDELLELLNLDASHVKSSFAHQLSGGQQQRVGVARALAAKPELLLMDEPFGALDPIIRSKAREELVSIQRSTKTTIVMVTHDMNEALQIADAIAVLDKGRLVQAATPETILRNPTTSFVEELIGANDKSLKLLALLSVIDALESGSVKGAHLPASLNLRDALAKLIWSGRSEASVEGHEGRVTLAGIMALGHQSGLK